MAHPDGIIGWSASEYHDHRNHRSERTTSGRTVPVHGIGGETVKDGGASVKSGKVREITVPETLFISNRRMESFRQFE